MGMNVGGDGDELNSEINVTPMIDVMLVLLVIFMITAPLMHTGVEIDLPKTTAQEMEESKDGPLTLSIGPDRKLYLGKPGEATPIPWKDLQVKLSTNEKVQKDMALYVEAPGAIDYAVVVTAMDIAKDAGVTKVMLLTDPTQNIPVAELDGPAK